MSTHSAAPPKRHIFLGYATLAIQFLRLTENCCDELVARDNASTVVMDGTKPMDFHTYEQMTRWSDTQIASPILFSYLHGIELMLKAFLAHAGRLPKKKAHKLTQLLALFLEDHGDSELATLLRQCVLEFDPGSPLAFFLHQNGESNEQAALGSEGTPFRVEIAGTRADMTNADFEFSNRVRIEMASQNGEDLAPTIANAARLRLEAENGGLSGVELAQRFGLGLVGAVQAVTVEPVLQVRDMGTALASVAYNELLRGDGDPMWLPEMKSGVAEAYANGASQTRLVLQSNPLTGIGVVSHDLTTATMNHDWGTVAEMSGSLVGGLAIGKAVSKYGGYGLTFDDIGAAGPMASQMGAIRPRVVTPLGELRAKYGVNEANLVVEATFEHQGRLFYDVNQTARNPALATDDRLPIYSESRARLGAPNQTRADAHAEVGTMAQSYEAGARGGSATLTIMGKDACTYCLSDVKRMGLHLQLEELTVIQPSGTVKFTGPQDFAPVKLGGKKWGG